jgi:hypothetical protein
MKRIVLAALLLFLVSGCTNAGKISPGTTNVNLENENHFHRIDDLATFQALIAGNREFILVAGQTTCGACTSYKVVLNELIVETSIRIYYIEINLIQGSLEELRKYGTLDVTPTTYLFRSDTTGTSRLLTQFGGASNKTDLREKLEKHVVFG